MDNSTQTQNINGLLIDKLSSLINEWLSIPKTKGWFSSILGNVKFTDIFSFGTKSLDELIQFVEQFSLGGSDKKQLVLQGISIIYDYVSAQAMPIFLKPFNAQIKNFIINILISNAIDFLVSKYNIGGWSSPPVTGATDGTVQKIKKK